MHKGIECMSNVGSPGVSLGDEKILIPFLPTVKSPNPIPDVTKAYLFLHALSELTSLLVLVGKLLSHNRLLPFSA